jgi:hypothetical protein
MVWLQVLDVTSNLTQWFEIFYPQKDKALDREGDNVVG